MRTTLVTGAAGFIGSNFVRVFLEANPEDRVVALDRANLRYLQLALQPVAPTGVSTERLIMSAGTKIGNRKVVGGLIEKHEVSQVVNFAAETHVDRSIDTPEPFTRNNVVQLQQLLDTIRQYPDLHFLQVSTDEVYGDRHRLPPAREQDALVASSPYAASKAAADLLVMAYGRTYGMNWQITRSTNNYGPGQFPEKLIPLMISKALTGHQLPVYGNGQQSRDWIHVDDNCVAIMDAMDRGSNCEIYNIGTELLTNNVTIVTKVLQAVKATGGTNSQIQFVEDRPGHDRVYWVRTHKLQQHTGWTPKVELDRGIRDTVDWYRNQRQWVAAMSERGYGTDRVGTGNK